MSITVFGIIWFAILIILFFVPIKYTIGVLLISTIFQSTAVINLDDKGITATLVTEAYLLLRFLLIKKVKSEKKVEEKANKKLINLFVIFFLVSIIISFLSSAVFDDIYIYNKFNERNPIFIGINASLIIRIIILFFNIISLYIIFKLKYLYDNEFIKKIVTISIVIVLFVGFWEFLWKATNKVIYFPYEFIYNNVGYAQGFNQGYLEGKSNLANVRMNSTFLEPSYCGCFLVASFYGILSINKDKKYNKFLYLIALAIVLNLSGTGILLLVVTGIYYFILNNKRKIKKSTIIKIFFVGIIFLIFLFSTGYIERILEMVFDKMESISGIQRSYYNKIALDIAKSTFFIGGGLNCYRASSFLCNLLGTVGIVGTFLFLYNLGVYLFKIRKKIETNDYYRLGYFYLIAVLIGMFISIPDITFLQMWFAIMYLVAVKDTKDIK